MPRHGPDRETLKRVQERAQLTRRSATWNVAHAQDDSASSSGSQSIHRALVLLNLVGVMGRDRPEGVALADLARVSGRPKASVHRVLAAMVQLGFVERVELGGRYRLGLQSQILGELAGERADPTIRASRDSLVRLASLSEDTTFLTVRQGSFSICARREEGSGVIRNNALAVGDRHPLGIGAGSLAILAGLQDGEVEGVLEANAEVLSRHYARIGAESLRHLVQRTRVQGYALNEGLVAAGSWAIGVPLRDRNGSPVAALSIASIEQRLSVDRQLELVAVMRKEVSAIESTLRHRSATVARRATKTGRSL